MVTISTCPSAAATGSTQARRGWQRAAPPPRDKKERDTHYTVRSQTQDTLRYDLAFSKQRGAKFLVFGESSGQDSCLCFSKYSFCSRVRLLNGPFFFRLKVLELGNHRMTALIPIITVSYYDECEVSTPSLASFRGRFFPLWFLSGPYLSCCPQCVF